MSESAYGSSILDDLSRVKKPSLANDRPKLTALPSPQGYDTGDEREYRKQPQPGPDLLYGLPAEVGVAATTNSEANPYAVMLHYMVMLSAMIGRDAYMLIGDTYHHARIFGLHVGRTARGRKGDALSLIRRICHAIGQLFPELMGRIHPGGLSSREGLVYLIHDGLEVGKDTIDPILDKRLWIVESEFSNVLHQTKRDGNTLSAALRDAWDGTTIAPATKHTRLSTTDPHIGLSGSITPTEYLSLLQSREMTNGFANRFLTIFSERLRLIPIPLPTTNATVSDLAIRTAEVIRFGRGDYPAAKNSRPMTLSSAATERYTELYLHELNRELGDEVLAGLLERRAPTLLRMAMLFALTDLTLEIDVRHIDSAFGWIRFWEASIRYIFFELAKSSNHDQVKEDAKIALEYITQHKKCTRTEMSRGAFGGHASAPRIDAAIQHLLDQTPPAICIENVARDGGTPGRSSRIYRLANSPLDSIATRRELSQSSRRSAKSNKEGPPAISQDSRNSHGSEDEVEVLL